MTQEEWRYFHESLDYFLEMANDFNWKMSQFVKGNEEYQYRLNTIEDITDCIISEVGKWHIFVESKNIERFRERIGNIINSNTGISDEKRYAILPILCKYCEFDLVVHIKNNRDSEGCWNPQSKYLVDFNSKDQFLNINIINDDGHWTMETGVLEYVWDTYKLDGVKDEKTALEEFWKILIKRKEDEELIVPDIENHYIEFLNFFENGYYNLIER